MVGLVAAGMVVPLAARTQATPVDLLITRVASSPSVSTRSSRSAIPPRARAFAPGKSSMPRGAMSFPDSGTCTCTSAAATH
jgi:hypothetical protein